MWKIYKNDIRSIFTNWVAAVLIGGLTLLPSLYAWINIVASWDPYSQTDQLPVGIVNEDAGAVVRDKDIHIGDDIVRELKNNDDMDWHFDDRKDAMEKVEHGDYFAVIVIPENFSQKLGTVIENKPEKAKIEYYVNEKINAIAPKITEKGAGGIVDTVTSNFISSVNGTIFEKFNELGLEIEKDLPDIKRFEEYVFQIEEKLPEIHSLLSSSLSDAENAQKMIDKAQALVPDAKRATGNGLQTINETMKFLNEAENRLNTMEPQIQENLESVQNMAVKINDFVSSVQSTGLNLDQGKEISNQINEQIAGSLQKLETIEIALKQLQETNKEQETSQNQEQIKGALKQIALLKQELLTIQENGQKVTAFLSDKQQESDEFITRLQESSAATADRIDTFVKEYNENIRPAIKKEVASANETLKNARNILTDIQSAIPEIEKILANTEGNLGEGEKTLKHLLGEFPYVNEKVNQLADRIREIQGETDINEIIELLQNDPEAEKGFFKEPVQLNKNSLFPIQNYGTGMTPFYTVLSIWVGALLLISVLATGVHHSEDFTGRQIYFGKLLTFLSIGFAQTLIVTLGDIFLLGVDVEEPVWFVLFGLISSLVFILIVYTLVSVFGDVGKAMAIVLLVLQIAGAGGTYPIALLPEFFQTIHPFLPFSYVIDIMREAVGGIVWEKVYRNLLVLMLFGIIALLFGTFLKEPLSRKTKALMKKSKESGLFH